MSSSSAQKATQVCIVGGGNASKLMAGLLSSCGDVRVHLLAPYRDEAMTIAADAKRMGGLTLHNPDKSTTVGMPALITADPAKAVPGSDLVILPLPAFAMPSMLELVAPHLDNRAWLGAMPAQTGFQWRAAVAAPKARIFGLDRLPYNVRTMDDGSVQVFAYKQNIGVAAMAQNDGSASDIARLLNATFPHMELHPLESFTGVTLAPVNQAIHPARLWGLFGPYGDGSYSKPVLFYESMDALSAETIREVSEELGKVAAAFSVPFESVKQGLKNCYTFEDDSTLRTMLRTADGYKGLYTPMIEEPGDGQWVLDVNSRYLTEDLAALAVSKGLAELANVDTPIIDKILTWGQELTGASFLTLSNDGTYKLKGKDVETCGAPQTFGIVSMDDPRL